MSIAVIGAGASGLLAAIEAARAGVQVTLIEKNATVGRKLAVTGSGRCNISNAHVTARTYTASDHSWLDQLFDRVGVADTLTTLLDLGIPASATDDGWYYPLSQSAAGVVNALESAAIQSGVTILTGHRVTRIRQQNGDFVISAQTEGKAVEMTAGHVIAAAGGKSYPTLGTSGDLFPILQQLGHSVAALRPALAPITCELGSFTRCSGQRFNAVVRLIKEDQVIAEASGNMIVTDWGFNGPAVMDLSNKIPPEGCEGCLLELDLMSPYRSVILTLMSPAHYRDLTLGVLLGAFLPPKVSAYFLHQRQLDASALLGDVSAEAMDGLLARVSGSRYPITGLKGFDACQVTAGGIPTDEVEPTTMQSKRVSGLYLCGELLDVVGPCGGYNLQFAFSTGLLAGRSAASQPRR